MPTTRRSTGSARGSKAPSASTKKATQTKLAFHSSTGNRISKRGVTDPILDKKDEASLEDVAALEPTVDIEHAPEPVIALTLDHGLDDDDEEEEEEEKEEEEVETASDEDLQLQNNVKKVTAAQMRKYWAAKEQLMQAPRAHFEKLSVAEKILREWDVDGRYGPSIGMTRTNRWKRANNLGLRPPIEIFAAIVQEVSGDGKKKGDERMDTAMIDRLMSKSSGEV